MDIHIEDTRCDKILYPHIEKELRKIIYNYKDVSSLNFAYCRITFSAFARYIGTSCAHLVDSGTSALILSLSILGMGKGDEVILPVNAYPATALAVFAVGGEPVFVDIKDDATIDDTQIEKFLTKKVKVIIPVHMYGHCTAMDEVMRIARKHNLKVLEDASEAHGSIYKGKKLGSIGDLGAFSFNPHKNISTLGGGGAVVFNDAKIRDRINNLIFYDYDNPILLRAKRSSSKMSFVDMAFINVKLKAAELIEKSKIEAKAKYEENLSDVSEVELIKDKDGCRSVRQFYMIYAQRRNELFEYLKNKHIVSRLPYKPLHLTKIFSPYCKKKRFPQADVYYEQGLCLPIFPFIKKEEVIKICQTIKDFYGH